jgi:hypothetical protein
MTLKLETFLRESRHFVRMSDQLSDGWNIKSIGDEDKDEAGQVR